jgi:hypothetical protein
MLSTFHYLVSKSCLLSMFHLAIMFMTRMKTMGSLSIVFYMACPRTQAEKNVSRQDLNGWIQRSGGRSVCVKRPRSHRSSECSCRCHLQLSSSTIYSSLCRNSSLPCLTIRASRHQFTFVGHLKTLDPLGLPIDRTSLIEIVLWILGLSHLKTNEMPTALVDRVCVCWLEKKVMWKMSQEAREQLNLIQNRSTDSPYQVLASTFLCMSNLFPCSCEFRDCISNGWQNGTLKKIQ